jgi:glycosyltransferase involved in cell wall biosynthesis
LEGPFRLLSRLHPGEKALPIEEVIAQEKAERSGAAPAGIPVAAPGVVYLRGAYASGFGQTSYRIAYHLPEFGLRTTLVLLGPHTARSRAGDTDILVVGMPGVPFLGAAWVQIATLFHLLSMKCDALVCNPGIFLCGWLYKLLRPHTPLIVDIRSVPVEVDGLYARFIDWTFTWSVRSQALDGLSVITAGMLADIQNRYGARRDLPCVVWASGVDGDLFDPSISGERVRARYGLQDTFVLMYHGTLSAGRGLSDAVKAVALLAQDGEQRVKLVFIGKGVHQSQLAELAETLKVADKVLFLPPVPHEQIPAYVAAADAGIDPLPDHPWWNYSSSMKVYEYLRMGKPVFASDIPAHHGISPALLLAPGRDPAALANSIKSWMSAGTAEREALRQAALESGASNTWRARAEVLALFLKRNFLKSGGQ